MEERETEAEFMVSTTSVVLVQGLNRYQRLFNHPARSPHPTLQEKNDKEYGRYELTARRLLFFPSFHASEQLNRLRSEASGAGTIGIP